MTSISVIHRSGHFVTENRLLPVTSKLIHDGLVETDHPKNWADKLGWYQSIKTSFPAPQ